jgi:hypothetical protein
LFNQIYSKTEFFNGLLDMQLQSGPCGEQVFGSATAEQASLKCTPAGLVPFIGRFVTFPSVLVVASATLLKDSR